MDNTENWRGKNNGFGSWASAAKAVAFVFLVVMLPVMLEAVFKLVGSEW